MGWLMTQGASKSDVIREQTKPQENDKTKWTCLAHCLRGNVLWTVWEIFRKETDESERFIACYLLRKDEDYGWGYKDMEESMHPYYYSCPMKYLKMVPEVGCQEWRDIVLKEVSKRQRKVEVGEIYTLPNCNIPYITITKVRPLRGDYLGTTYKIRRKQLGEKVEKVND